MRLVLDTNIWLDWLLFDDPDIRTLSGDAQVACLAECRRVARMWPTAPDAAPAIAPLPVCADPDDQKFLDLAVACGAQYLVTRDRDLLELARFRDPVPPFRIVTPRQWREVAAD